MTRNAAKPKHDEFTPNGRTSPSRDRYARELVAILDQLFAQHDLALAQDA